MCEPPRQRLPVCDTLAISRYVKQGANHGRVKLLEKWQSDVIGFGAGLSLFLVGITIALSVKYRTRRSKS